MRTKSFALGTLFGACFLFGGTCATDVNVDQIDVGGVGNPGSGSQGSPPPGANISNGSGTPSGGTLLLSETAACQTEDDGWCRLRLTFTPTQAGRTVTIEVVGNTTASRPVFGAEDAGGNLVANVWNEVSNRATASFSATNTGPHYLTIRELAAGTAVFTVTVRQN